MNHNHNRTFAGNHQRRRAHSLNSDDNLDLFSRSRRSSLDPSDHNHVTAKLAMLSVGSGKQLPAFSSSRNGVDDLLASSDTGKHDYDWLLTPPETPLHASSERSEFHSNLAPPPSRHGIGNGNGSISRSGSGSKPSRLSTSSNMETTHSTRPGRSRSLTRSSVSSTPTYNHSSNRSSSILNTSSSSVSSYIRPSSPVTRSSSASRPSTPSTRTSSSRSSTPSKPRSSPSITSTDRTRPSSTNSRPSTPTRAQVPAILTFPTSRSNSRPSTPTRRNSVSAPSAPVTSGRVMANGRANGSNSRPSSPSPRVRPQQPVIPADFPVDTPPNLRTTLSDRAVSAGRSRPGGGSKVNMENSSSVNLPKRPSSPAVARGRSVEPPQGRGSLYSNGYHADMAEPRRSSFGSESVRKPVKSLQGSEGGFGRTISKKSIDMAIRHMDIRNGTGPTRPLSTTALFPQSVRSIPSKIQTMNGSSSPSSTTSNGSPSITNNSPSFECGPYPKALSDNNFCKKEESGRLFGRLAADVDMFESTRYDTILLKEDLRNTTWLHSVDDKSDQCSIFDGGFESLPEPFGLL